MYANLALLPAQEDSVDSLLLALRDSMDYSAFNVVLL